MDEGPQVSVTGDDAVTGAGTGTDAGEPGAGVAGDATASEPGAGLARDTPAEVPATAEWAADLEATTPDDAGSAQPDELDLASVPDQPEQPEQPDQPAEASEAPEAASPPDSAPTVEPGQAAELPLEPPRTEDPAPTGTLDPGPAATLDAAPSGTLPISELAGIRTAVSALGGRVDDLANASAELSRLRSRDTDLIDRLHEDVTRLRTGEIATALNPVVTGMIKLHDQMVSLGAMEDPASSVGMLRTQLLQIMELTCAVKPFTPAPGERFDASRHMGARRIPTTDTSADGTIASTIKVGFARADGSVVRVAEVEVHRLSG
jgi:hypothetical protein